MQIMRLNQSKKLLHLIRLGLFTIGLKIEISCNIWMLVNMVAAAGPHQPKTKGFCKAAQFVKAGVTSGLDLRVKFNYAGHDPAFELEI